MRILLAEDEKPLAKALVKILEKNNYSAEAVHNGADALEYARSGGFDALILDIMMPIMDGITVLRTLRSEGFSLPVLILSARSEIENKVEGLDSGANYYLTKPFDSKELVAALRAITRATAAGDSRLHFANICLDRATYELSSTSASFRLANKEFQMMEMLMLNPGIVISAERFFQKIWGLNSEAELNVVWVYISYLRKKLAALNARLQIKAIRNTGYCLEEKDDK